MGRYLFIHGCFFHCHVSVQGVVSNDIKIFQPTSASSIAIGGGGGTRIHEKKHKELLGCPWYLANRISSPLYK